MSYELLCSVSLHRKYMMFVNSRFWYELGSPNLPIAYQRRNHKAEYIHCSIRSVVLATLVHLSMLLIIVVAFFDEAS